MLSRVAGSVYWMFRYLERAQNIARFINADFNQYLEDQGNQGNLWVSLLAVTGDAEVFHKAYPSATRENIIHFLTLDEDYDNSIYRCIVQARENARSIREIISSEMWEEINTLYLMVGDFRRNEGRGSDPFEFCKSIIQSFELSANFEARSNSADVGRRVSVDRYSSVTALRGSDLLAARCSISGLFFRASLTSFPLSACQNGAAPFNGPTSSHCAPAGRLAHGLLNWLFAVHKPRSPPLTPPWGRP